MRKMISTIPMAVCALLLTSCQAQQMNTPPEPTRSATVTQSPIGSPSQTPSVTATPVQTSSPSTQPSSTAATTAAAIVGCVPSELKMTVGDNNGAAGTEYQDFIFENTSDKTCDLQGYPRVQVIRGTAGEQVGQDAARSYWAYAENKTDNPHVTLKPGAKAYAQLAMPSIYNYATGKIGSTPYNTKYNSACGSVVKAAGYRMYLPGETVAAFIRINGGIPICDNDDQAFIRVSEIVPNPTNN